MKALKATALTLAVVAVAGCGQGYSPSPDEHIADPRGGGNVFTSGSDGTVYKTASYDVLRATLTGTMMVSDMAVSGTDVDCPTAVQQAAQCPKYQPIAYLAKNAGALGAPTYNNADPLQTIPPGPMTTGGFKAWILASTGAAGIMMQNHPEIFFTVNAGVPDVTNYDLLYQTLLGRNPTLDEVTRLNQVEADVAAVPANASLSATAKAQRQGAAAVSSVLASMEFLMVN